MMDNNDDSAVDFLDQYVGNYRLLRSIGRGAFASVYLGEHRYLKRLAAIKVLHTVLNNQDKESFLEEARLLASLSHPHIVPVHEFAVVQRINHAGGRKFTEYIPYLVMDFAPGGSLRALCPAGSCLFIDEAISYLKQIAVALQYAHDNGIIHRDVKPENCLFNEQGEVILSDFGLALFAPTPDILSTQQMAGTLPYTAPEQLRGKPGFASDQYSLGVIAYEWLCGHRPFDGEEVDLILQHMSSPPPSLRSHNPAIPQAVEEVVLKALEKNPHQRYPSVQAFARALEYASQRATLPQQARWSGKAQEQWHWPLPFVPRQRSALPQQVRWLGKVQEQWYWPFSFEPRQWKITALMVGILAFMLILSSTSVFYLKTLTASFASPIEVHTTVTRSAAAVSPHLPAMANFTVKPPLIQGMALATDETSFEGDHAALGAGQQVVVGFSLPSSSRSGTSSHVSVFINALVARSGNNHGYAPVSLYCNGHAIVQNFTFPGVGFLPNETGFQIPPGLFVRGKNEIKLLVSSDALGEFWLYHIGIGSVLSSTPSVANFTVNPPGAHGMTLVTDETSFGGDHAALNAGQQVVIDFSYPDSPASGKSRNMNISINALISRLDNRDGYAPMSLYCNGQVVIQNFTLPGNGFQPNETSFQVPPAQLVRGKNEVKLLISANAQSEFWLYSIGMKLGTPY
jgi:serine/threonine protein kinase